MKILRKLVLLYNAIFLLIFVSISFISGQPLSIGIILVPVVIFFLMEVFQEFFNVLRFVKSPVVFQVRRLLIIYSALIVFLMIFAGLASSGSLLEATMILVMIPLIIPFISKIFNVKNRFQFKLKNIIKIAKINKANQLEQQESLLHAKSKLEERGQTTENSKSGNMVVAKQAADESSSHSAKVLSETVGDQIEEKKDLEDLDLAQIDVKSKKKSVQVQIEELNDDERNINLSGLDRSDASELIEMDVVDEEGYLQQDSKVSDAQKRQFLKILGGGGASLFVMLFLLPRQASAAFFGSAPGPGIVGIKDSEGNKIDPAEKKPTDGYTISEIDDDDVPSYYGFIHKNGSWYIAREDSAGGYRYATGTSGFASNWSDRTSLIYGYFDSVF